MITYTFTQEFSNLKTSHFCVCGWMGGDGGCGFVRECGCGWVCVDTCVYVCACVYSQYRYINIKKEWKRDMNKN